MSELLSHHTTFHLGGPAAEFVTATTEEQIIQAVTAADAAGTDVLVLGGGSNLVVADAGFAGTVVKLATTGVTPVPADDGAMLVTVAAGETWDDFVATAVDKGWSGIEALSGIPGSVGATPIQNVGAYGQDVSQTITSVKVFDRQLRGPRTFTAEECRFGYRWSRFKAEPDRHVVLEVTFRLGTDGATGSPIAYAQLAGALGVGQGTRVPSKQIREAVLALRRSKGMVIDEADHDTWSAGSFFTNPVVAPEDVPDGAPAYPQPDGTVKTSAAWLIDHAGFTKGHGNSRVALSTKHTLALTNRGDGTTEDLLALAREVRDGVEAAYGIVLVNEPVMLGVEL
ncbi:UDP-N-acetylmuramate dehydrogenase [Nocardioides luteus]|uniref:UDP-N-acetylenolpyruvoylglucosamine reductase n=1 Tax=Nocardioides luteus TaxID=1844 RepID=A0ABQ5T2E4_9ACTN|nr:UDP-N-acetylmuramate dehydrogenase [Nocardioides luteus]MDR7313512.1 UDP-N-acetylmuramate dehydrogenase [Nocardioides luteus]GGR73317.1 UDP-N-acetylenolpyruvoylglucosamine reductase [Nocardioides luteus]GLJ70053.1 UDP-N-acetylenolpyruvoylglucosamine reductase [Nocardioides luteus]